MNFRQIAHIRNLMDAGLSNTEIADIMAEEAREAACDEAEARDRELEDDYAHEADYPHHAYNDRLDMGRNEAGEWLGFM